jgi:DNA-binding MarR family transcriptional regulator
VSARDRATPFDLEDSLTFKVSMLYNRLALGTSRELANGFDLTLREWRVLALLARNEPMTATALVARSPLDKASVSRTVARLVDHGFVSVAAHAEDARARELELTRAGKRLYGRIAPRSIARQNALLSVLNANEKKALFHALDKLMARAADLLEESAE